MSFSAYSILSFCRDHNLLQLFGHTQLLTVRRRSHTYVNKVKEALEKRGCQIRTDCEVNSVSTNEEVLASFFFYVFFQELLHCFSFGVYLRKSFVFSFIFAIT